MIHELTLSQISALQVKPDRPLVICDVDEVIVHFTREFEDYLALQGLWLEASAGQHLHLSLRAPSSQQPISPTAAELIIHQFFAERTLHMKAIDGAIAAMLEIATCADVVMLTNLPHAAGDSRRSNLAALGISFPVITNSGPKGPAVERLASQVAAPVVFIDDSPGFINSAYEHAPHVHLIHFVQDARFEKLFERLDFVSLRTGTWSEAGPHVMKLIAS